MTQPAPSATATSLMIVKADIDGDMRRFNVELTEDAPTTQMFQAIRAAVAQAFDMEVASLPALKYQDPEGDMCTLVAASLDDMLELNNRGTLRLFAASSDGPATLTVEAAPEAVATEVAEPSNSISEQATDAGTTPDDVEPPACQEEQPDTSGQDMEDELPPQEERPETWGHELPEDPIEASEDEAQPELQQHTESQEPEDAAQPEPEEQNTESSPGSHEVETLMAMGFSREQSQKALQDAHYDVELAIEYLINGRQPWRKPLEKLEGKVRALPGNVTEQLRKLQIQLREVVANLQEHRVRIQERFQASTTQAQESEHLQSLQAALEEVKGRLREFKQVAQAAVKKARGGVPDAEEEEKLQKVEAQIAEAQRFVSETLATLHARGSEVLKGATTSAAEADGAAPEASEHAEDEAEDSASVVMETMDAAATAAVDAAEVAMATVDEMLFDEPTAYIPEGADAASPSEAAASSAQDDAAAERPSIAKATVMDHAQVFLSKSISAFRSQASGLLQPNRNDNWVDIPSSAFAPEAAAGSTADTSVAEPEGANAVPAPTFHGSPDDEFLLVTDAATQEETENAA